MELEHSLEPSSSSFPLLQLQQRRVPFGGQQMLWGHRLSRSIFLGDVVLYPTVGHSGEWSSPGAAAEAGEPLVASLGWEQVWESHGLGCGAGAGRMHSVVDVIQVGSLTRKVVSGWAEPPCLVACF